MAGVLRFGGRTGTALGVFGVLVGSGVALLLLAQNTEPPGRMILGGLGLVDGVLAAVWILGLPGASSLILARAGAGLVGGVGAMFALGLERGLVIALLSMVLLIAALPRARLPMLLILPGTFYLLVFFSFAVGIIAVISFMKRGPYGGSAGFSP
jgi:hypothetical protein